MGFHYLILVVGTPLVLIGIAYMYVLESKWYEGDFKIDEGDGIE